MLEKKPRSKDLLPTSNLARTLKGNRAMAITTLMAPRSGAIIILNSLRIIQNEVVIGSAI